MKRLVLSVSACFALGFLTPSPAQAQNGRAIGLEIAASRRPVVAPGPAIPEPTGALLFAAGLLAAGAYTRKRRTA